MSVRAVQRRPGQTQHLTPPWVEHVPDRLREQLYNPSLQTAVIGGVPVPMQVAFVGIGTPLQEGTVELPDWLTEKVRPPMFAVALRAPPVFDATAKVMEPLPLPLEAPVMESHAALEVAVQPHPAFALTLTVMLPADDPAA
jgi:hypothetical protein